jgi:hypothetical protein
MANASKTASWHGVDEATQSIYNIVKAPLGWSISCDGVKLGGIYGSKEAALKAATVAAMFAVRDGARFRLTFRARARKELPRTLNCIAPCHRQAVAGDKGMTRSNKQDTPTA